MDKTTIIVVEDNIVYCEFVCTLLFNKTLVSRIKSLSSMVAPKAIGLVMVTDLIADGGRWSRELMRPVRAF